MHKRHWLLIQYNIVYVHKYETKLKVVFKTTHTVIILINKQKYEYTNKRMFLKSFCLRSKHEVGPGNQRPKRSSRTAFKKESDPH